MKPKEYFKQVSGLIETGFSISEALDELAIDGRKFYSAITSDQKIELNQLRASNKEYVETDTKDLHEFFTTDEYAY